MLPRRDEAGVGALPDQVKGIPLYRDAPQPRYESGGSEIGKMTGSNRARQHGAAGGNRVGRGALTSANAGFVTGQSVM